MKKKTIKNILQSKMDKWVASVTDDNVKNAIKNGAIVTGGSIASMLRDEEINDFDIYFKTKSELKTVIEYYAGDLKITDYEGRLEFQTDGTNFGVPKEEQCLGLYKVAFISPNAVTLTDQIQIVNRFYGEIEEIHKNYDFVHATNSYDYKTNQLILRQEALESLLTSDLIYIGSKYPLTSVIRTKKFVKRGWTISAGQYVKMLFQVADLDLRDPEVLREQLIGVDIAYFAELIAALDGVERDKIEYTYIGAIIDKIFEQ